MRNRSNQFKLYNTKKSLVFVVQWTKKYMYNVRRKFISKLVLSHQNLQVQHSLWSKVKSYNCHKNKIRTNEPKIWQNNKNTEPQPKLSGSYKKKKVYLPKLEFTMDWRCRGFSEQLCLCRQTPTFICWINAGQIWMKSAFESGWVSFRLCFWSRCFLVRHCVGEKQIIMETL